MVSKPVKKIRKALRKPALKIHQFQCKRCKKYVQAQYIVNKLCNSCRKKEGRPKSELEIRLKNKVTMQQGGQAAADHGAEVPAADQGGEVPAADHGAEGLAADHGAEAPAAAAGAEGPTAEEAPALFFMDSLLLLHVCLFFSCSCSNSLFLHLQPPTILSALVAFLDEIPRTPIYSSSADIGPSSSTPTILSTLVAFLDEIPRTPIYYSSTAIGLEPSSANLVFASNILMSRNVPPYHRITIFKLDAVTIPNLNQKQTEYKSLLPLAS